MKKNIKKGHLIIFASVFALFTVALIGYFVVVKTSPDVVREQIVSVIKKSFVGGEVSVEGVTVYSSFTNYINVSGLKISYSDGRIFQLSELQIEYSSLLFVGLNNNIKINANGLDLNFGSKSLTEQNVSFDLPKALIKSTYDINLSGVKLTSIYPVKFLEKVRVRNFNYPNSFGFEFAGDMDVANSEVTPKFNLVGEMTPVLNEGHIEKVNLSSRLKLENFFHKTGVSEMLKTISGNMSLAITDSEISGNYQASLSEDKGQLDADLIINKEGVALKNIKATLPLSVADKLEITKKSSEILITGNLDYDYHDWDPNLSFTLKPQEDNTVTLDGKLTKEALVFTMFANVDNMSINYSGKQISPMDVSATDPISNTNFSWIISGLKIDDFPSSVGDMTKFIEGTIVGKFENGTHSIVFNNLSIGGKLFTSSMKILKNKSTIAFDEIKLSQNGNKKAVLDGTVYFDKKETTAQYKYSIKTNHFALYDFLKPSLENTFEKLGPVSGELSGVYILNNDEDPIFECTVNLSLQDGTIKSNEYKKLFEKIYSYLPNEIDVNQSVTKFDKLNVIGKLSENEHFYEKFQIDGSEKKFTLNAKGKLSLNQSRTDLILEYSDTIKPGLSTFLSEIFGTKILKTRFISKDSKIVLDQDYTFKYLGRNLFKKKNRSKLQKIFENKNEKTQKILDLILGDIK